STLPSVRRSGSSGAHRGACGRREQVALAFSQWRERFPPQGSPRFLPICLYLVLDAHHRRRHFRLASKLDSNSRSLLELERYFFTVPVKNENGGRDDGHFIWIGFAAFSLGCRGGRGEKPDCRDHDCSVHGAPSVLGWLEAEIQEKIRSDAGQI